MAKQVTPIRKDRKRNPEVTRAAILNAALQEFSEVGHSARAGRAVISLMPPRYTPPS